MKHIGIFLLLAFISYGTTLELTQQVQPALFVESEDAGFELNRAIAGIKTSLKLGNVSLKSDFKLEFSAYDNLDKFVKKATVTAIVSPWFAITAGRVRVPFGENHARASRKLDRISRSHTASYIKKQLSLGERAQGFMFFGEPNEYLAYEMGIFEYSNNSRKSGSLYSLGGNSFMTVTANPAEIITFGYSYSNALVSNDLIYKRFSAHDLFLSVQPFKWFSVKSEYFIGPDAVTVSELSPHLDGYKEHLGKSLYTTLSLKKKMKEKSGVITLFWERLWGENPIGDVIVEREFQHALGTNLQFHFAQYVYLDLEYEERLGKSLTSLDDRSVTLQFTFYNKIKRSW